MLPGDVEERVEARVNVRSSGAALRLYSWTLATPSLFSLSLLLPWQDRGSPLGQPRTLRAARVEGLFMTWPWRNWGEGGRAGAGTPQINTRISAGRTKPDIAFRNSPSHWSRPFPTKSISSLSHFGFFSPCPVQLLAWYIHPSPQFTYRRKILLIISLPLS